MSGLWHKKRPELLKQFKEHLQSKYPDLGVLERGDVVIIQGGFPVMHEGVELDRFQIRVEVPPNFPRRIPSVSELAGRVPRNDPSWHTFDGGSLCLMVPEEWMIRPDCDSLMAFFEDPIRNYFLAHSLAEEGRGRPMGERPHFAAGLWEAYGEMVGSTDRKTIEGFLNCLAGKKIRGHWYCPCGSGRRTRNCHLTYLLKLKKQIKPWIARSALDRLRRSK